MANSSKAAFAKRLVEAMLAKGYRAARGAKAGVDVAELAKAAATTREMARRYVTGQALPDANRVDKIAEWLGLRVAFLRDGEGTESPEPLRVKMPAASSLYNLAEESIELARVWQSLPPERQRIYKDMIFIEAATTKVMPWLRMHAPNGERYQDFELRVQQDFSKFARQLQLSF